MRRPFFLRSRLLGRTITSLALVSTFLFQLGCDRQRAIKLSSAGVETTTTLFQFYETLAQHTNDTREMEMMWVALVKSVRVSDDISLDPCNPRRPVPAALSVNSQNQVTTPRTSPVAGRAHTTMSRTSARPAAASVAPQPSPSPVPSPVTRRRIQGPNFGPDHGKLLTERVQALRSRALMARQLANFISTIKTYSESDPGAKVEEAANKLGTTITGLIPIPGVASAVPLLAGFAGDLKRWQQHKKIKEQMKIVQSGLSQIRRFYDREAEAYTAIIRGNSNVATAIMQELIKLELVKTWDVFSQLPTPYGMKWAKVVDEPEKRDEFKCAFIEVIRFRNDRFMSNAKNATENMQDALAEFDEKLTEFLSSKDVSWDSALAAIGRAKFYIKEINNMRNGKESEE